MAKDTERTTRGVSLDPDDQVVGGGLFGAGEAVAKEHVFGPWDYNGKRKAVPALLVTFEREGEEHTEAYTVGNGWKISQDGEYLIPRAGQTGLSDSCKAAKYLAALRDECGMPKGTVRDKVSVLDGISGTLDRKPLEKVEGSEKAGSILIFTEVDEAPWASNGAGAGAKKKKKAEAGTKATKSAKAAEDDDDEDDDEEAPPTKKGRTAKAAPADDDDDTDADEDVTEEAVEALITALDDGPLKLAKVEGAVLAAVPKKNPQREAIAALAASKKFLQEEKGWSFDGRTVELD